MADSAILAEASIWGMLAALAFNFTGLVARFPYVFLSVEQPRLQLSTHHTRLLLVGLAACEILIDAGDSGNLLPPLVFLALAGTWLRVGWEYEGEAYLHWLGSLAIGTAIVLIWQSLP